MCSGTSCIAIATSPNSRSRSTSATRNPSVARTAARLVATVVFPHPPFAENTVTTRASREVSPSGPRWTARRRREMSTDRRAAATTAPRSSGPTTSRTPARSAWPSTWTSTRRRSSTIPTCARSTCQLEANARAWSRSASGPTTTSISSGWVSRSRWTAAGASTRRTSSPRANDSVAANSGSASTMRVTWPPRTGNGRRRPHRPRRRSPGRAGRRSWCRSGRRAPGAPPAAG